MSTYLLTSAMYEYLESLASLQQWDLSGEDSSRQVEGVRVARARLIKAIDNAANEATADAGTRAAEATVTSVPFRILVALDYSGHAAWSVRAAVQLAIPTCAELVLLHVINPGAALTAESALAYSYDEVRAAQLRKADALLTSAAKLVPVTVPVEELVREGDAAAEIVAAAREWEADLIVLGTRGRGRFATFLLGSTAEEVIRHARCPVVSVGHDPDAPPPPAEPDDKAATRVKEEESLCGT